MGLCLKSAQRSTHFDSASTFNGALFDEREPLRAKRESAGRGRGRLCGSELSACLSLSSGGGRVRGEWEWLAASSPHEHMHHMMHHIASCMSMSMRHAAWGMGHENTYISINLPVHFVVGCSFGGSGLVSRDPAGFITPRPWPRRSHCETRNPKPEKYLGLSNNRQQNDKSRLITAIVLGHTWHSISMEVCSVGAYSSSIWLLASFPS